MLDAEFMEEVGMISDAVVPAVNYRLVDRSHATLFPRTFSPKGLNLLTHKKLSAVKTICSAVAHSIHSAKEDAR